MKRLIASVFVLAMVLCGLSACGPAQPRSKQPEVVASIFPLFDAASFVGGKHLHIANLLPLDPFGTLTPKEADELRNAKLAIILGHGTQPEVEKVAAERTGPTLNILDAVAPLPDPSGASIDPYIWLDPQHMLQIVETVNSALIQLDPHDAIAFQLKANGTEAQLENMDKKLLASFATCQRKEFLTDDPRYQYLAKRYGLTQIPVTDDSAMAKAVAQYSPSVVYFKTLPSLKQADAFRAQYGAKASTLDPLAIETDQARRNGATYFTVMDLNTAALWNGLGCTKVDPK